MTLRTHPTPPLEVPHNNSPTVMVKAQLIALTITCLLGTVLFSLLLTAYFAFSTPGSLSCILIFAMVIGVILFGIALISICKKKVGVKQLTEENQKLQKAIGEKIAMLKEMQEALVDTEACVHELAAMLEKNQKKLQELEEKHEKERQQSGELRRLYQDSRVLASELETKCNLFLQTGTALTQQLQALQIEQAVTLMERGVAEKGCYELKSKINVLQHEIVTLKENLKEQDELESTSGIDAAERSQPQQEQEEVESQEGDVDLS